MIDKKKLGEYISKKMSEEKISIDDMANKLGITKKAVRNYINGVNLPSSDNLCTICGLLKIELKDLMIEEKQ